MIMVTRDRIWTLANRVAERAASSENALVRDRWREHNGLKKVTPPVVCRVGASAAEIIGRSEVVDPLEYRIETFLMALNYKADLGDDQVFEPWITLPAVFEGPDDLFGLPVQYETPPGGGAYTYTRQISAYEDIEKLQVPVHRVDEAATGRLKERAEEILGGILDVRIDRMRLPFVNLGYYAASFLGVDNLLLELASRPDFIHALMARLRDIHLQYYLAAERDGLLGLNNDAGGGQDRVPGYTDDLPQSDFDGRRVRLRDLWVSSDSQELGLVSPAMLDEFLLRYEMPLFERFGLVKFGCCESHHNRWHLIKQIPNLRRVSVSPWTSLSEAVEEMGGRAILNWRVNNMNVVGERSPEKMRKEIREGLEIAGECPIEIVLQDIETVYGDKNLLHTWVRIAREEANKSR